MEKRFLYEIRPVRPVNINGRITRVPTSINLTKAEVKQYMAYGAVYRRFGATDLVKVTGANLDSLHVSKEDAAENKVINVERHGEVNLGIKIEEKAPTVEKEFKPVEETVEPVEEVSSDTVDDGEDKAEEEDPVDNSEDAEESTDSTSEDEINDAEDIDSEADNDSVDAEMENSEDSAVNTEEPAEEKRTTAVVGYHANNNQKFNKKHRHNR